VREFHDFLASPVFVTCARCWRAWYHVDVNKGFKEKCDTNDAPWFAPHDSEILKKWCFDGVIDAGLAASLPGDVANNVVECACGARGPDAGYEAACHACGGESWSRQIATCHDCLAQPTSPHAQLRRRDYAIDPLQEVYVENNYRAICTIEDGAKNNDAHRPSSE
jgi:hypothetical protein